MPGRKWSTVLVLASIGTRVTADQVVPFVDVLNTMSFSRHPRRKRQSDQATKTRPAPSISALGSGPERKPAASVCSRIVAMRTTLVHDAPPFVETKASTVDSKASSIGTTTVPLGCTTGWPPMTVSPAGVVMAGPQVMPPSVDVLIWTRLPLPLLSHST